MIEFNSGRTIGVLAGCDILLKRCGMMDAEAYGIAFVVEREAGTLVTSSQGIIFIILGFCYRIVNSKMCSVFIQFPIVVGV